MGAHNVGMRHVDVVMYSTHSAGHAPRPHAPGPHTHLFESFEHVFEGVFIAEKRFECGVWIKGGEVERFERFKVCLTS